MPDVHSVMESVRSVARSGVDAVVSTEEWVETWCDHIEQAFTKGDIEGARELVGGLRQQRRAIGEAVAETGDGGQDTGQGAPAGQRQD